MAEVVTFTHDFRDNKGFQQTVKFTDLTPDSRVTVSICEVGNIRSEVRPHMGQATLMVHNVVPEDDRVRVRGYIDWDDPIDVRLSFIAVLKADDGDDKDG